MHRLSLVLALMACGDSAALPCPAPTVARGSVCTLEADATLDEILDVPSGTHLDCGGHRLTPGPKSPLAAIVVHDAQSVTISGCKIEGFEQGIYLLRSPTPAAVLADPSQLEKNRNRITDNQITARVKGITLLGSEDARVENNVIHFASNFGYGIGVFRSSSRNVVASNTIDGAAGPADETPPADFPPPYVNVYAPPDSEFAGNGIYLANSPPKIGLIQFIMNGELYQFGIDPALHGVEDNVVENNMISTASTMMPGGVSLANRNLRTVVRGNTVTRADTGVLDGGGNIAAVSLPSTCVARPQRLCHQDADCNLALPAGTPADTCKPTATCIPDSPAGQCWQGTQLDKTSDYRSHDVTIANNVISGVATGIDAGSVAPQITGNHVSGASRAGINLAKFAIDSANIESNALSGNGVGLAFAKVPATATAVVASNDIVGSLVRPLAAPAGWKLKLTLSAAGKGNFWGHACPNAFVALPPAPRACTGDAMLACDEDATCAGKGVCATTSADAPNDFLADDHPFGVSALGATTAPCK
jgi:hypothetical protein